MSQNLAPTEALYGGLNRAYDWFNARLFEGRLPGAIITLQRHKPCIGYYKQGRFNSRGNATAELDEISLNPSYFGVFPVIDTMSTLVHEMAHQEQHHFGKPSRGGYHNGEWADMMVRVGLMPSSTGRADGTRTGPRVTHMIVTGGVFEMAAKQLLDSYFLLQWYDRFPPPGITPAHGKARVSAAPDGAVLVTNPALDVDDPSAVVIVTADGERFAPVADDDEEDRVQVLIPARIDPKSPTLPSADVAAGPAPEPTAAPTKPSIPPAPMAVLIGRTNSTKDGATVTLQPRSGSTSRNKVKYKCPKCGCQAWGKPNLNLICGDDRASYEAVAADSPDGISDPQKVPA